MASGKVVFQSQGASGIYESLGFMVGGVSAQGQLSPPVALRPLLETAPPPPHP